MAASPVLSARADEAEDRQLQVTLKHLYGRYVRDTPDESARAAKGAADGGDTDAMCTLAAADELPLLWRPNFEAAIQWYLEAVRHGAVCSTRGIARAFVVGGFGLPRDPVQGADWLVRGARQGDWWCMFHLSLALEEGTGIPRDRVLASAWAQVAGQREDHSTLHDAIMRRVAMLEQHLTPAERLEAGRLVAGWHVGGTMMRGSPGAFQVPTASGLSRPPRARPSCQRLPPSAI